MTRPEPSSLQAADPTAMKPDILASDDPEALRIQERNAFYESLAIEAKSRFLEALARAQEQGMGQEEAWREAVIAAETTYAPAAHEAAIADDLRDDLPPPGP